MFEEQELKIRAKDLENFSHILIELKDMGEQFKEIDEDHEYDLVADHNNITAMLHLYKLSNYDNTEQDEEDN
jgi:hypothetical protein